MAVVNEAGVVLTDANDIAAAQKAHWSEVFKERHVDTSKIDRWLEEEKGKGSRAMHAGIPPADDHRWKFREKDVRRAIDLAGKSAPGPDGIPFEAYKKLGVLATGFSLRF